MENKIEKKINFACVRKYRLWLRHDSIQIVLHGLQKVVEFTAQFGAVIVPPRAEMVKQ